MLFPQPLCPQAKCENFFAKFELRILRPEEDLSVYKWELEKADQTLSEDAKTVLLMRQFSRGLPPSMKLLEHNPHHSYTGRNDRVYSMISCSWVSNSSRNSACSS
jgi:hypothetical protein